MKKKILMLMLSLLSLMTVISCENTRENEKICHLPDQNCNSLLPKQRGIVIKVYDGDTLTLQGDIKIRLYGIDAPELNQKGGKLSKNALHEKVYGKQVEFDEISKDRYGRIVAKVYIKGEYVNRYMLENGLAWWYSEYAADDTELRDSFESAKNEHKGIFKDYNIEEPSEFRKRNRKSN